MNDPQAQGAGVECLTKARLDRAWYDAAIFPVCREVPTRFSDTDMLAHVNNVAAMEILQEGRTEFNRASGNLMVDDTLRAMVGGMIIEYAAQIGYPGSVEVRCGIVHLGRTSYTLAQLALQDGRPALYAQATLVMTDGLGPTAMPEALLRRYSAFRVIAGPARGQTSTE